MTVLFQALLAFFAVIGIFEVLWQILLWFTRRATKAGPICILVKTDQNTDPAFLQEDLRLLESRFMAEEAPEIWLICPEGASQEDRCRTVTRQSENIRIVTPEQAQEDLSLFFFDP